MVEILTGRHQNSCLVPKCYSTVEKRLFQLLYLKMGDLIWACNCSLVRCLDCSWWRQFSGPVGRNLRQGVCWKFVEDLRQCNLKHFWKRLLAEYQGSRRMLYNVIQNVDWIKLCIIIWIEFKWTGTTHTLDYIWRLWLLVLIFLILSVKREANSLQALVFRSSEATDTGGIVSCRQ